MAQSRYKTLTHNGPWMPQPYQPRGFKFDGKPLSPLAEEIMWHWAIRRDTEYTKETTSKKNFVASLAEAANFSLSSTDDPAFKRLVDEMFEYNEKQREIKKQTKLTKAQRDAEKAQRDAIKNMLGFAVVDGKRIPINGFLVEAAGPLITRGNDPRKFCWKYAVKPEQVIVNLCGADAETKRKITDRGHKIVSDPGVLWVFKYDIKITGGHPSLRKKVNFAATSELAQGQEEKKYEKALELLKSWDAMQKHIKMNALNDNMERKQCALATYLIQLTGIRVGNERDLDHVADTVGASTLVGKNLRIAGNKLTLSFLGKDSVPYENVVDVEDWATKEFAELIDGTEPNDKVFDRITSADIGDFIKEICPEASPKTFRSAIGTATLCEELNKLDAKNAAGDHAKKSLFVRANLKVGQVLNHQKNVGKGHADQIQKVDDTLKNLDKQIDLLKKERVDFEKKAKRAEADGNVKLMASLRGKAAGMAPKIEKAEARRMALLDKKDLKEATKQTALGTSLNAYCSPRVVFSWCKDVGMAPEKIYTKTQIEKFIWAKDVPAAYWKSYIGYLGM